MLAATVRCGINVYTCGTLSIIQSESGIGCTSAMTSFAVPETADNFWLPLILLSGSTVCRWSTATNPLGVQGFDFSNTVSRLNRMDFTDELDDGVLWVIRNVFALRLMVDCK